MNGNFLLGSAAFEVNENLPNYLISRLKQEFDLTKLHIAILGTSFKGNIDDSRSSLAYKLRKLLEFEAKLVTCVEPYASDYTPTSLEDALNSADIFVIGAPHDQFRNLNTRKPIVDIWNLDKSGILIKKSRE
jgi:UDP-N-acetyl-D-mannosaminuronic acid dehydrogenase